MKMNLNITLSRVLQQLSKELQGLGTDAFHLSGRLLKQATKYFLKQLIFLASFKYTRANIKAHLMEKALTFFGYDIEEGRVVKSIRKWKRKNQLRRFLKDEKTLQKKEIVRLSEVKAGKKYKNSYIPPS